MILMSSHAVAEHNENRLIISITNMQDLSGELASEFVKPAKKTETRTAEPQKKHCDHCL
jgi:hypothetical protein